MRPLKQIVEELVEAGRTAIVAADPPRDRPEVDEFAVEAIAHDYEVLPPDEQEAVRIHLAVPLDGTPRDVGMKLLPQVRGSAAA
jgi:hypothetical protein